MSLNALTLLILLALVGCCSAYIEVPASNRQGVATQTTVFSFTDAVTSFVKDQGRRLGWVINWLASTGVVGQLLANVLVAIFILPPLGPIICGFFDNCDNLQVRARHFLRAMDQDVSPAARKARLEEEVEEGMTQILTWLDNAYHKYST